MPYGESIPSERLVVGKRAKFLLKDVLKKAKTYPIILSRADKKLVE
jgi:transcription antitermination factor NusA-like protein